MKKVLILGAGLVVKPMIEYLLYKKISVTVASPMKERADSIINGNPLGTSIFWSMEDKVTLDRLVSENDLTVSLLPYKFHSEVAVVCLKNRKHLVTTSYVQPEMLAMKGEVEKAGLLFLNESGLDPGIDHMSAMKIIDDIHSRGGKVEKFISMCGALPAPEAIDNPLGYKFSWSPKGVVLASKNGAVYLRNGQKVIIEPLNLFRDSFVYDFKGIGAMEVYPNRDSISYIDIYRIPEVTTMYRGTFRYKGWCETLDAMKHLNMLDDTVRDYSKKTNAEFLAERAGIGVENLRSELCSKLVVSEKSAAIKSLEFLGFFSKEKLNYSTASPFEIVSDRMIERMMLGNDERDMVAMQHIFLASFPDDRKEVIKSSILDYGSAAADTSISRTVALPAAIAVRMILENKLSLAGVYRPVVPEIYIPVLNELKTLGIEMKEEYGLPVAEMIL